MHEEQQQSLLQQNALLEQRVLERTAELSAQKETLQQTLSELKQANHNWYKKKRWRLSENLLQALPMRSRIH